MVQRFSVLGIKTVRIGPTYFISSPYADGINSEMVCRFFRFFRFFFCERNAHCFDGVFPLSGFVTPMIRRVPLAMARAAGICVISTWCVSAAVLLLKKTKKFDIINQLYPEKFSGR